MHWSDNSIGIDKYLLSFLGCDKFLLWGEAHIQSVEGDPEILLAIGYIFKKFINNIKTTKEKVLKQMKINPKGKIISFFDESFGGAIKMTEEHFVVFWETIAKVALERQDHTILIKPKVLKRYENLSDSLKKRFMAVLSFLEKAENTYIIDSEKWSFIEVIGMSDIVITQGMTSSATIAIICGIEGLYLDQAHYNHPFSRYAFKERIIFDDPEKLLRAIYQILDNDEKPSKTIPEELLRKFDTYPDDRAIAILQDILSGKDNQYTLKKQIGIIIQARMGSSRLPGKVMMDIMGKPMLKHTIERLKRIKTPNTIIIATTYSKKDDIIAKLALEEKINCFRGDEEDVLMRYYQAAKEYKIDTVVRITADCPLIDPGLVDEVIDFYLKNQPLNYASNTIKRTYPRGFDIEIFSFSALEKAFKNATKPYQREHVTPFIYENERCLNYKSDKDYSKYRVTVDTAEDFKLIDRIFDFFGNNEFSYQKVIDLLNKNKGLAGINRNIKQKAFTE
jgi:spore coat polysaccharide biosynthesis protein SpsF